MLCGRENGFVLSSRKRGSRRYPNVEALQDALVDVERFNDENCRV